MSARRFRIRDLLKGRTLIEAGRGRDIVAYHEEHYVPGRCEWAVQFYNGRTRSWDDVPAKVQKAWIAKHKENAHVGR